jgi:hypothetical protein
MKLLYATGAALPLLVFSAAAQDEQKTLADAMAAQIKVVSLQGGVMGKPVKGAPYSGVEVNESTQMLADGTRIHNETQTQVFRDGEGRMRRENGTEVTIWDPVANASYVLNAKSQTARKLPMGNFAFSSNRIGGDTVTYTVRTGAAEILRSPGPDEDMAKFKAELDTMKATHTAGAIGMTIAGPGEPAMTRKIVRRDKVASEPLGKQTIEGVSAEGTRQVSTIDAGAIGNDRPIQSVSERWFSNDLQTVMLTRRTDPRSGEEVFKLINVNRAEPAAYLFQIPAGYQIVEQK